MSAPALAVPAVHTGKVTKARVDCPYCKLGWADVVIGVNEEQTVDLKTPHRCVKCFRYFFLKIRLRIVGITEQQKEQEVNGA